ncbi:MAG: CBU_0592 family membrane protein [Rhizobiaceae bacterium]
METLSLMQIFGLAGFATYIGGFTSIQFGIIDGNSRLYSVISITAASLVLASLMEHFNLASALIQVSWITIGICGIVWKTYSARRMATPFTVDDREEFVTLSRRLSKMRG